MTTQNTNNTNTEKNWMDAAGEKFPLTLESGYWKIIESNIFQWATEASSNPLWTAASRELSKWQTEYVTRTRARLLSQVSLPAFVPKSCESIQDKISRKFFAKRDATDLFSGAFPVPMLGDLVRTRIRCNYIDGVDYIAKKIMDLAENENISATLERQGKIEGYYAQHINIEIDAFLRVSGVAIPIKVKAEIQIASDMATKMWDASHGLYELTRGKSADAQEWQWDPSDPRFIANQLGHMVHLADGLLVQLRDIQASKGKK